MIRGRCGREERTSGAERDKEEVMIVTRILIADDHPLIRRGLRTLLEGQPGWSVVAEAKDGYEAIEASLRTSPDIVIMDDAMPRMNGIESTRRIRQRLRRTEVCLLTDSEDESVIANGLPAGARGFVLKSDGDKEILAAIDALSKHQPYFSWVVSEALLDNRVNYISLPQKLDLLTPREREVVQLVAEGMSNKQVGKQLNLSIKTVETHRGAAMRKAGLSSTADLVRYAVRNHMVSP
jgi:RNA polymerase sigma factor (sigma-70 family)